MAAPQPRIGNWYRLSGGELFEVVAIDDDEGSIDIQYFDGTVEEMDRDDWESQWDDGALEAAQKATQLMPQFSKAWNNLGSAYRGKLQYPESESAYKRATQLDPNYADAYFNLGILYLDAKQMPGTDLITKLNTAINYFNKYKQLAGYRLIKVDPVDTYVAEARTGIDREQKRILRMQKQQQRGQPKPAPAGKTGEK